MILNKGISVILYLALTAGLAACGNKPARNEGSALPAASSLGTASTNRFTVLLRDYYGLKDALVRTNSVDADKAAAAMQGRIKEIHIILNTVDTTWVQRDSLQQKLDSMAYNLDKILAVKDESCETKRIYFKPVSATFYDALKLIRLQHVRIYHTFCPMAFREKGAFWLSNEPEIKNPYFGAKMIECGEVIDTLQ
jgi:hypothetical protein